MLNSRILRLTAALAILVTASSAQGDLDQCALSCIEDVDDTNCAQSDWSCLCASDTYIDQLNSCVEKSCSSTSQKATYIDIAELCEIYNIPLSEQPEATVSITSLDHSLTAIFAESTSVSLSPIPTVTSELLNTPGAPGPLTETTSAATATVTSSTSVVSTTVVSASSSITNAASSSATSASSSNGASSTVFASGSRLLMVVAAVSTLLYGLP